MENKKRIWYKTWWGILVLILFWPFSLSYFIWKSSLQQNLKYAILAGIWIFVLIGVVINSLNTKSAQTLPVESTKAQQIATPSPTQQPKIDYNAQLFEAMKNVGADKTVSVQTDYGHIQAIQQTDGTWVVTKIQNSWPEIAVSFGLKNMSFDFIKAVYNSGLPIKQAGISFTAPKNVGNYYFRMFLGSNHAQYLSQSDWNNMGPSAFYDWVKSYETSVNEPDRADRTVIEERL